MTKITWASTQDFVTYLICKAHLKAHADISILARSKCWSKFSSTSKLCVCEQQGSGKKKKINQMWIIACRWWPNIECWLGSFVIFQGIWPSIAKKPYLFVIFQGGPDPLSPPLGPHMVLLDNALSIIISCAGSYCIFTTLRTIGLNWVPESVSIISLKDLVI